VNSGSQREECPISLSTVGPQLYDVVLINNRLRYVRPSQQHVNRIYDLQIETVSQSRYNWL